MNLLWNLFRAVFLFLLSAVARCLDAFVAVLAYLKQIGAYLKSAFAFIRHHWKTLAIVFCGAIVLLFGLLKNVLFHILVSVIYSVKFLLFQWYNLPIEAGIVLLLFFICMGIVVLFRKAIFLDFPRYIEKNWSYRKWRDRTGIFINLKAGEPQLTHRGLFYSQIVIPILSAVGMIAAVCIIFSQVNNQSKQLGQQEENTKKQFAEEQYRNAINQLGSKEEYIILSSVYSLHNLARIYPNDYSYQVFDMLCRYIQVETAKQEYKDKETNAPSIVIQTIVNKLFREKVEIIDKETGKTIELYQKINANLAGAILQGANLGEANLRRADLEKANLQGAGLYATNLQEAKLIGANLREANLWKANLLRADLKGANLQGAKLWEANLQGANLDGAILDEINRQWLIEIGIIKAEDFPPQPDDESIPDET